MLQPTTDRYGDPVFQITERMRQLIALMDPLDDELDALRAQWPNPYPFATDKLADPRAKALERIRELRRQLAALGKEYWDISLEGNAAWHAQKPMWQKKFASEPRSAPHPSNESGHGEIVAQTATSCAEHAVVRPITVAVQKGRCTCV